MLLTVTVAHAIVELNREHCSRIRNGVTMALHVIVGAGPVGTATATLLAERGERVRVLTRRGGGPQHPAIERIAADATDADRLAAWPMARPRSTTARARSTTGGSPTGRRWPPRCWPPRSAAVRSSPPRATCTATGRSTGPSPGHAARRHPAQAGAAGPDVARRAGRTPGRPDQGHRGARQRLHRGQLPVRDALAKPLLAGKRPTCRDAGHPAQLDVDH